MLPTEETRSVKKVCMRRHLSEISRGTIDANVICFLSTPLRVISTSKVDTVAKIRRPIKEFPAHMTSNRSVFQLNVFFFLYLVLFIQHTDLSESCCGGMNSHSFVARFTRI